MKIKKIHIVKFRGFKNISFDLGTHLTAFAGQNGTQKTTGFLGVLKLGGKLKDTDAIATEYSVQSDAVKVDGKRIDFPTLVPTLTQKEIDFMINDIIPNNKPVPEPIMQKAIIHAKKRIKQGKGVFAQGRKQQRITLKPVSELTADEARAELARRRANR